VYKEMEKGDRQKGRDGYERDEDEPEQPRGFKHAPCADFSNSEDEEEPNRLKAQGAANFGPYTEQAIRAIARDTIISELKKVDKMKAGKPFDKRANGKNEGWTTSESSRRLRNEWARWYDVNEMKCDRKKAAKKAKFDEVFAGRMTRKKA